MILSTPQGEREFKDAKQIFLEMGYKEQMAAMYEMLAYFRLEMAVVKKVQIDTNTAIAEFQDELREVRRQREARELKNEKDLVTTTEKIAKAILATKFDFWSWFRDKVLPGIILVIVLAVLYMTFGGTIPPGP